MVGTGIWKNCFWRRDLCNSSFFRSQWVDQLFNRHDGPKPNAVYRIDTFIPISMGGVLLRYKSVNSIETVSLRPIMSILKLIYSLSPKKWAIAQVSTVKNFFSHTCTDHCAFRTGGGGLNIFRFFRKFFGLALDPWSSVGQMGTSVTWFRCILGHPSRLAGLVPAKLL